MIFFVHHALNKLKIVLISVQQQNANKIVLIKILSINIIMFH